MHGCKYNCYNAFDGCSGYIWYNEGKFLVVIKLMPLVMNSMHTRGLCCHAVSVRPSVCPSVRHVRGSRQNE